MSRNDGWFKSFAQHCIFQNGRKRRNYVLRVCVCSSFRVIAVAGVAHRLHSKHGKNVVLLGEGCQAVRVGGYAHGIAFSAKELKTDELFEVRKRSR